LIIQLVFKNNMKKKQILINNSCISYCQSEYFDANNCLLFLHWWWQDYNSFSKIYKNLDKFKKTSYIWIDFPGFWWSVLESKNMSIYDYADFTIKFIKKLKLIKPSIIWHSFWWRVNIVLWSNYDNLNKIILIWAAGIKPKTSLIKKIIVKTWKIIFSIPGLMLIWNILKNKIWSTDYINSGNLKNIFLNVINEDLTNLLDRISYKTLLIWWKNDKETPILDWELMNRLIKKSKLKTFNNWTHFVFQEYSKEISKIILDFQNK